MNDEQTPDSGSAPPGVPEIAAPPQEETVVEPYIPGSENPCGPTTSNRDEARFILVRENGSGEREVSADKYESLMRESQDWICKYTNFVSPHHSDNY